ncbi:MAG TPA: choice-of-anchor D domain-containing protein [Candidatus Acidoferrales bacterium]|nr:choice-of-anchor D domain-containing protein [Candidatus Acidoferrales bacterium]
MAVPREAAAAFLSLPLGFEPNRGQAGPDAAFLARGQGYTLLLGRTGALLEWKGVRQRSSTVRMRVLGANPALGMVGLDEQRGKSNYLRGNDPRHWITGVPHYGRVRLQDVYPGIALVFYGSGRQFEYDFVVQPGAAPERIALTLEGAKQVVLDASGNLHLHAGDEEIVFSKPVIYQQGANGRASVEGGYVQKGSRTIGFRLGPYDRAKPLWIDPALSVPYTTFLGGSGNDTARGIALDSSGKIYIGGTTTDANFPESPTARLGPGGGTSDFFVAKIDPAQNGANSLVYLTFIGGSGDEEWGAVAADSSGDLALAGTTTSSDYPVTDKSKRSTGANDAVVSELNPAGNGFVFSTYFGADGMENTQGGMGIAIDGPGNVYLTSDTTSTKLPVTFGAFSSTYGGGASDGFLAAYTHSGTLFYCSYFGIGATVGSAGIAVDASGNTYIAGFTSNPVGTSFPAKNAFQPTYGGDPFDAFLLEIDPKGLGTKDLVYATFLGGSGLDKAMAVAVDTATPPNAYVTGVTQSVNFPVNGTNAPYQGALNGPSDAFVSVVGVNKSGMTVLNYSTFLGGTSDDTGLGIAAPATNLVYVAGETDSYDFPTQDALQGFSGTQDAFLARFDPTMSGATSLIYATYLGGSATAQANAVAADSSGHVFLTGSTDSSDYPQATNSNNGFQPLCSSCNASPPVPDAFLTEVGEGTGPAPGVAFTPPGLNFGDQPVGSSAPPQSVVLKNVGNADLLISAVGISGVNSGDFSQINNCPLAPTPLPAGASCTITATFTPSLPAREIAAVSVADNLSGSPHTAALTGTGTEPVASPSPTSLNFGNQPQGTVSNAQTVTLTNTGDAPLQINGINLSGMNLADFTFAGFTCGTSLGAGASCTINIVFMPQGVGSFSAELDIFDNSGNVPGAMQAVPITGMGTPPAPIVGLAPTMLNFGTEVVGGTTGPQTVVLTNSGSAPLLISSILVTGANANEFNLLTSGMPCPTNGNSLAAGANCDIVADFAPLSSGSKSAAIQISDNAANSPQSISLSGMATAPIVILAPTGLAFAPQDVGSTSAGQTVMLTNTGTAALSLASISFTGANPGDFAQTNNCPPLVNPNASCLTSVTFTPTATGNRAAALTFTDNAAGNPQLVPVTGTATAPIVTMMPASINFNGQLVGSTSNPAPVQVQNGGNGPLNIRSIGFSGSNAGDFRETDNCGAPVNVGSSCTINVVFKPSLVGSETANLQVTDNAPGSPQSIPLSGTGTSFSFSTATGGSTSATVSAGQSAVYNLQLVPGNGFGGMVTLSCSGAPPAASCTASPGTLNVNGPAPVPFMVNVTTTARGSVPSGRPAVPGGKGLPWALPLLLAWALALAAMALAGSEARRLRGARPMRWLAPAGVAVVLLMMAGCGGSGGGGGPSGTPAGTYTLVVTGTQQGGTVTIKLTLTVK